MVAAFLLLFFVFSLIVQKGVYNSMRYLLSVSLFWSTPVALFLPPLRTPPPCADPLDGTVFVEIEDIFLLVFFYFQCFP